jgi:hypothetical protein
VERHRNAIGKERPIAQIKPEKQVRDEHGEKQTAEKDVPELLPAVGFLEKFGWGRTEESVASPKTPAIRYDVHIDRLSACHLVRNGNIRTRN